MQRVSLASLFIAGATLVVAAVIGIGLPMTAGATGGKITVTNTNDSGPGSLRQAIADATPGETVVVPRGMYTLTSGELEVSKSLTIAGAGATSTTIDAQGTSRVFHTGGASNEVTISGLTITGGEAVPVPGTTLARGGGVLNDDASLTLHNDLIAGDQANADGAGTGGAGGLAQGGGLFSGGPLRLVNVVFVENVATSQGEDGQRGGVADGGGAQTTGPVVIRRSEFGVNGAVATGGQGAPNSQQSGGDAFGGGLEIDQQGPASVSASTFERDVADGSAGPGGSGGGGAFGGGELIDGTGGVSQRNVTFAENVARATAGITQGGALEFDDERIDLASERGRQQPEALVNSTLTGDRARLGDQNLGGEVAVDAGASVAIENTIIAAGAGDAGSQNCFARRGGLISSRGHNIDSRNQCRFHARGDRVNTSPLLTPLADNGGPVATTALAPGSPAIDAAAAAACPSTDARGVLRPAGAGCDIGAFEIATPSARTGQPTSVRSLSAVLHGKVANPDLARGTAFFQFGKTTALRDHTPAQRVKALTRGVWITARLRGLSPATTYHFRIVVTNAAGTVVGAEHRLVTPPAKHPASAP